MRPSVVVGGGFLDFCWIAFRDASSHSIACVASVSRIRLSFANIIKYPYIFTNFRLGGAEFCVLGGFRNFMSVIDVSVYIMELEELEAGYLAEALSPEVLEWISEMHSAL